MRGVHGYGALQSRLLQMHCSVFSFTLLISKLGIVITKTAPAVLACSRSDLSRLCKSLWTRLWRIPLFLRLRNVSAMLSAESGGLCLGTATRSGVMPILLRSPLHYIVWHNRNEVYVKKLYIVAMVVLNLDIQM